MLSELPSEIIYHIAKFLPTANAITHLAQSCRRLYKIITAEESGLFRVFVQHRFPSIRTPPFWKDAACALTSRSRALDRLGIIGRFVTPPENITRIGLHEVTRRDNPTLGYRPAIDSYEVWNGGSWAEKKEVLAWGAGHQLVMRIKQSGNRPRENWAVFNDVEHASSYHDICGVHLLGADYASEESDTEHLIFSRMRGDIVRLALSATDATHEYKQKFMANGRDIIRTDLSDGTEPLLSADLDDGSIAFYHMDTAGHEVEPFALIPPDTSSPSRKRYSKLLSSSRVSVANVKAESSLSISTVSPDGISPLREIGVDSLDIITEEQVDIRGQPKIIAMAPLNTHPLAGSPGDIFLAAWGDNAIRLHDLRSPRSYETTYRDTTDRSIIYHVHPFGHDRFLTGSAGNALVKIFDLRKGYTYNYLDAQIPQSASQPPNPTKTKPKSRNFSLFLSAQPPQPTPATRHTNSTRNRRYPYRGPIYTMSTPSPSSQTVYTGVVDAVIRLDFASTDDLTGPAKEWYDQNLDLGLDMDKHRTQPSAPADQDQVFRIAGYEHPDPKDVTRTSKLRTQHRFWYPKPEDRREEGDTGWDRRWEALEEPGAWRRRDG